MASVLLAAFVMPLPPLLAAEASAAHAISTLSPAQATSAGAASPSAIAPTATTFPPGNAQAEADEPRVVRVHVGGPGGEVDLDADVKPVVFAGAAGQTVTISVTAPEVNDGCLRAAVHEWTPRDGLGDEITAPTCLDDDGTLPDLNLTTTAFYAVTLNSTGELPTEATAAVTVDDGADLPVVITPDASGPRRLVIPPFSTVLLDFPIPEDRWAVAMVSGRDEPHLESWLLQDGKRVTANPTRLWERRLPRVEAEPGSRFQLAIQNTLEYPQSADVTVGTGRDIRATMTEDQPLRVEVTRPGQIWRLRYWAAPNTYPTLFTSNITPRASIGAVTPDGNWTNTDFHSSSRIELPPAGANGGWRVLLVHEWQPTGGRFAATLRLVNGDKIEQALPADGHAVADFTNPARVYTWKFTVNPQADFAIIPNADWPSDLIWYMTSRHDGERRITPGRPEKSYWYQPEVFQVSAWRATDGGGIFPFELHVGRDYVRTLGPDERRTFTIKEVGDRILIPLGRGDGVDRVALLSADLRGKYFEPFESRVVGLLQNGRFLDWGKTAYSIGGGFSGGLQYGGIRAQDSGYWYILLDPDDTSVGEITFEYFVPQPVTWPLPQSATKATVAPTASRLRWTAYGEAGQILRFKVHSSRVRDDFWDWKSMPTTLISPGGRAEPWISGDDNLINGLETGDGVAFEKVLDSSGMWTVDIDPPLAGAGEIVVSGGVSDAEE